MRDDYSHALVRLRDGLLASFPGVDIRGADAAAFVFAEFRGRAVEVSGTHEGHWWIEFWEASEEEYNPPVREETHDDETSALAAAHRWLSGKA